MALRALEHRIALEADHGRLRADAERNALTIARALAFAADWRTMVARPGWDTLMERTGLSRSTIARYLALFNSWGLLGRVRAGSTRRTRGGHPDDTAGNLAGEYVLCVPAEAEQQASEPVEITRTPSNLREEVGKDTPARAREDGHPEPTAKPWPIGDAPQTRRDQLHASERLTDLPVFRGRNARYVRSIVRPCYAAGWSPAQIRYALDHTPAGTAYWHTEQVRHPAAWAKHRLAAWQREDDTWITPPVKLGAGRTTDLDHQGVAETFTHAERLTGEQTTAHAASARQRLAEALKHISSRQRPQRVGLGVSLPDADGRITAASEPERAVERADAGGDDWLLRNAVAARGIA